MQHFKITAIVLFLLIFTKASAYAEVQNLDIYYLSKSDDKQIEQNININPVNDRIISESSRNINAIYPIDTPTNSYPGYRGTNQLVVYTRAFGENTGTNEFGKEAIIKDGIVVALTGANSTIPSDGYVVSGHGSAKKWINDNLKIGTKIEIYDRTIKAYTTVDSCRYQARAKIKQVQEILISTKYDAQGREDKLVYTHLKKAKQKYKKSKKDNSDLALNCAKEAIDEASIAFRYTLPYIKDELKGVWIRPNSKNISDIQKTLDEIKATGVNNVFIETFYHGRTIFPSYVMKNYGFEMQNPEFKNTDILALWIQEAHKRNIKVHCWFESFYVGNKSPETNSKSILAQKPLWMNRTRQKADYMGWVSHPQEHNGYFLDPANPEVVDFLIKLISELSASYNIDGLNIDYVRYPNIVKENYSNQWGYTQYARNEFLSLYEVDPIELERSSDLWDKWCEYRSSKITDYVRRVSELLKNRNIVFSAVIFPDYKTSLKTKFQDWLDWSENNYINAFTPLILTGDDELAKSMLEEIKKKTHSATKIYPGLFAGFIESDPEDLLKQIHIARKLHIDGIVLFDWAHLNNQYRDVLKTSAFKVTSY
ncbi:MAG: family 10 glycosylhydrolase [Candidatus Gastranaerophilales bacterium]|nr:family 10 glycosylhydrolase [Candidatus Gastranaerophilales bacterium]